MAAVARVGTLPGLKYKKRYSWGQEELQACRQELGSLTSGVDDFLPTAARATHSTLSTLIGYSWSGEVAAATLQSGLMAAAAVGGAVQPLSSCGHLLELPPALLVSILQGLLEDDVRSHCALSCSCKALAALSAIAASAQELLSTASNAAALLRQPTLHDGLLPPLLRHCSGLQRLQLDHAHRCVDDAALAAVASSCKQLRVLALRWCQRITEAGLVVSGPPCAYALAAALAAARP